MSPEIPQPEAPAPAPVPEVVEHPTPPEYPESKPETAAEKFGWKAHYGIPWSNGTAVIKEPALLAAHAASPEKQHA